METIASRRSVLKQTPTRPGSLPGNGSAVELCYLWGWGPKVSVESKNLIWSKIHLEIPEGAALRPLRSKSQELASFVAFLFVTGTSSAQASYLKGREQPKKAHDKRTEYHCSLLWGRGWCEQSLQWAFSHSPTGEAGPKGFVRERWPWRPEESERKSLVHSIHRPLCLGMSLLVST